MVWLGDHSMLGKWLLHSAGKGKARGKLKIKLDKRVSLGLKLGRC